MLKALNANGPLLVREGKLPKAPGPSSEWSALWNDDPIEFIDIIDSPPKDYLSPFREPAQDLKDIEADAGDKVFSGSFQEQLLTILDIFNGFCNSGDLDHGISEDYDDLPTLKKLLLDAREIRRFERAGLSDEYKERHLEYATKEDCDSVTSLNSRWDKDTGGYIGSTF